MQKNYIKTLFKNISTLKDFVVGIQGVKINFQQDFL